MVGRAAARRFLPRHRAARPAAACSPGADTRQVSGTPPCFTSAMAACSTSLSIPRFGENGIDLPVLSSRARRSASAVNVHPRPVRRRERDARPPAGDLRGQHRPASPRLLGGRLALTGDGYLFLSLGDRWDRERAGSVRHRRAASSASRPTGRCRTTIPSSPRAGRTARDLELRSPQPARSRLRSRRPASYGPTSTGRRAATSSISSSPAATTAGRSPPSASTIPAARSPSTAKQPGTELPVHYWVPFSIAPSSLARRDPARHHRNLDRRAGRRDGGATQPRRQLRAHRAASVPAPARPRPRCAYRCERRRSMF